MNKVSEGKNLEFTGLSFVLTATVLPNPPNHNLVFIHMLHIRDNRFKIKIFFLNLCGKNFWNKCFCIVYLYQAQ